MRVCSPAEASSFDLLCKRLEIDIDVDKSRRGRFVDEVGAVRQEGSVCHKLSITWNVEVQQAEVLLHGPISVSSLSLEKMLTMSWLAKSYLRIPVNQHISDSGSL